MMLTREQSKAGWERRQLGRCLVLLRNGIAKQQNKDGRGLPVTRIETIASDRINPLKVGFLDGLSESEITKYQLEPGDVLFSHINSEPQIGRTALYEGTPSKLLHGMNLLLMRPSKSLDAHFLHFALTHLRQIGATLALASRAVGQSSINQGRLQALQIPFPDKAEQRQIALVLSAVQRAIERQERLIALAAELKKALMHKLFTEGTRGEPLKQTEIGPVPESWVLERCEDLCKEISVGVVVRPRSYYVETGVPAFRSLNVREDRLETDDLVYFSKEVNDETLYKSKLRAGDVLIVRTGYPGTSCVVPPEYEGSNCIDIVFARPGPRITSDYLSRFFNSDSGKIQATAAKHGLAQQHLNVGAVKRVQVPLPALEEQCAIVDALAAVDAKRGVHMRAAQRFGVLFRTLLDQLMTAQVRVHDLDVSALDEPTGEM